MHFIKNICGISEINLLQKEFLMPTITFAPSEAKPIKLVLYGILFKLKNAITLSYKASAVASFKEIKPKKQSITLKKKKKQF